MNQAIERYIIICNKNVTLLTLDSIVASSVTLEKALYSGVVSTIHPESNFRL